MKVEGHDPFAEYAERDLVQARTDRRGQRDHEQEHGERHGDLGDPGYDRVYPASEVARNRSHQHPDDHHPEGGQERNLERDLGAVEQAQELVLAQRARRAEDEDAVLPVPVFVGVAEMRPRARGLEVGGNGRRLDEEVVRAMAEPLARERCAAEGGRDQEDDEDPARDGHLVALEPAPDELPVAARANRLDVTELTTGFRRDGSPEAGGAGDDDLFFRRRHGVRGTIDDSLLRKVCVDLH